MVVCFEQQFSVFKQHYTYFHTLFHPHVFPKDTNNVSRTILSNGPNFQNSLFDKNNLKNEVFSQKRAPKSSVKRTL